MKPGDFAPILTATIASLKDGAGGLPAKIAAYNAEGSNAYDLEVPVDAAYYMGGDDTYAIWPFVEIAVGDGALTNLSQQQVHGDLGASLAVAVWLEGATGEIPELYLKALGYGRVIAEVLMVPDACGPLDVEEMRFSFPCIPVGNYNEETRSFDHWRTAAIVEIPLATSAERS